MKRMTMKKLMIASAISGAAMFAGAAQAATYDIDNEGAHASINSV